MSLEKLLLAARSGVASIDDHKDIRSCDVTKLERNHSVMGLDLQVLAREQLFALQDHVGRGGCAMVPQQWLELGVDGPHQMLLAACRQLKVFDPFFQSHGINKRVDGQEHSAAVLLFRLARWVYRDARQVGIGVKESEAYQVWQALLQCDLLELNTLDGNHAACIVPHSDVVALRKRSSFSPVKIAKQGLMAKGPLRSLCEASLQGAVTGLVQGDKKQDVFLDGQTICYGKRSSAVASGPVTGPTPRYDSGIDSDGSDSESDSVSFFKRVGKGRQTKPQPSASECRIL